MFQLGCVRNSTAPRSTQRIIRIESAGSRRPYLFRIHTRRYVVATTDTPDTSCMNATLKSPEIHSYALCSKIALSTRTDSKRGVTASASVLTALLKLYSPRVALPLLTGSSISPALLSVRQTTLNASPLRRDSMFPENKVTLYHNCPLV